jgi:uncharacterized protein (DUF58 family)
MFWDATFGYGLLIWDILVVVAWVADASRLPRPGQVRVTREFKEVPALAETMTVCLRVANHGAEPVIVEVTDSTPSQWASEPPHLTLHVRAQGTATGEYQVRPMRRGEARLGPVYLRCQTAFHLAEKWLTADLAQSVRVYPSLEPCKQHTLYLVRSRAIEQQKRLLRHRGLGREFESLREYQQGDEVRDICWTASARRGKLVSRLFQAERSQAVWIVIDSGRLLRARVGELSKLDHAVNAAVALAQVALHAGDRVGLIAYGRKLRQRVPLGRGSDHLRVIVDQLAQVTEEQAEADHLRAAAALMRLQRRRALLVWITDLAETSLTPEVVESTTLMSRRHLVLLALMGQPDLQKLALSEPELTATGLYRYTAALETVHRRDAQVARVREHGALALEVEARELAPAILNQYLEIKDRSQL